MSQGYTPSISIDFEQTNKVLWYMISERNSILICNGQVSFLSGYPISKLPSHSWGMLDQACSRWEAGFLSHHFSAARTWAQIWPEQDLGSQAGDSKVKGQLSLTPGSRRQSLVVVEAEFCRRAGCSLGGCSCLEMLSILLLDPPELPGALLCSGCYNQIP